MLKIDAIYPNLAPFGSICTAFQMVLPKVFEKQKNEKQLLFAFFYRILSIVASLSTKCQTKNGAG